MQFEEIPAEGLRVVANMESHYESWLSAQRTIRHGRLRWKTSRGHQYLYQMTPGTCNERSLGQRSPHTESLMEAHSLSRKTVANVWDRLLMDARICRAIPLPRLPGFCGNVLRELDVRGLLGNDVIVVSDHALVAYELEANRLMNMDVNGNLDLLYIQGSSPLQEGSSVFVVLDAMLIAESSRLSKRNIRSEEDITGKANRKASPENVERSQSRGERVRVLLADGEQEWLLRGHRMSHVVSDTYGKPTRVVVPDPRWWALYKLWRADQQVTDSPNRIHTREVGMASLYLVLEHMPHLKLDATFEKELPNVLRHLLQRWRQYVKSWRP